MHGLHEEFTCCWIEKKQIFGEHGYGKISEEVPSGRDDISRSVPKESMTVNELIS